MSRRSALAVCNNYKSLFKLKLRPCPPSAAEPRKTTTKVERLRSTMDVEKVDRLDGLDSDSSRVAHQPADSIMREVSDKHPEEISELVRPLRPPDNAPHVQLEAKPRRLERESDLLSLNSTLRLIQAPSQCPELLLLF